MNDQESLCPCGSGQPYPQCCGLYHGGEPVPTAEKLMRSRFCAYFLGNTDYLTATTWPRQQAGLDKAAIQSRADDVQWTRLDVIRSEAGQINDNKGIVEFRAWFTQPGDSEEQPYHETSDFIREDSRWYFIYPGIEAQMPARNDPCICGSGRKYKKCCMK
ncbi:MAG: YchJ family protein [Endozoicomonas sp.]